MPFAPPAGCPPSLAEFIALERDIHKAACILRPMPEKEFTYTVSNGARNGVAVLALDGPFTLGNMFKLQSDLRTLTPPCLIMDLSQVPYMDSAGLGIIMNYFVSAQSHGRKFFVTGVNDRLRALLEMTKVDNVLQICDSIAAAEALA